MKHMKEEIYIILSEKKWNTQLVGRLKEKYTELNWLHLSKREDFTFENLNNLGVTKIFIPHWSYIIPENIYSNFECIVFHMTDLPYGRGGSPLQNLIVRGHKKTKISALRVVKELDAGAIYLKKDLDLSGTAEQIYFRANNVIEKMIEQIVQENLKPKAQEGEVVTFKRRTPEMSNLKEVKTLEQVYDMIRMLDAEGYPHAFIETDFIKIEFVDAQPEGEKVTAKAIITVKEKK